MGPSTIADLGRQILEAEQTNTPLSPLTAEYDDLSLADAYAIQDEYSRLRLENGATLVGRKIGCTSEIMQQRFSINTPDYGRIFDDMVLEDGEEVQRNNLIAPMVEPEIGFILKSDLKGPDIDSEDVIAATAQVKPCLEIIDSRIEEWNIEFEDTVADNGSSAKCVVGDSPFGAEEIDLQAESVQFFKNGEKVATDTGEAVLGHPTKAVAWLVNAIAEYNHYLEAGQIILSGSITNAIEASQGDKFDARFEHLGSVSCRFV